MENIESKVVAKVGDKEITAIPIQEGAEFVYHADGFGPFSDLEDAKRFLIKRNKS